MRAIVTGQVGMDKKGFLQRAVELSNGRGAKMGLCNVGQLMYREGLDIKQGRILDLPLSRLTALRRAVFKDIIAKAQKAKQLENHLENKSNSSSNHIIVNTHATFRWRHGLFGTLDFDQMKIFD